MTPAEILKELEIRDRPLEVVVQKDELRTLVEHVRREERERAVREMKARIEHDHGLMPRERLVERASTAIRGER